MKLEELIEPYPTNHGVHDRLINNVSDTNELSPNVETIAKNAYYRVSDKGKPCGYIEGDIDLLQMFSDYEKYSLYDWNEIPFNDATLLVFEMKSHDCTKNYHKALKQLKKSRDLIKDKTQYQCIDTFYAFNVGKGGSYSWRYEQV